MASELDVPILITIARHLAVKCSRVSFTSPPPDKALNYERHPWQRVLHSQRMHGLSYCNCFTWSEWLVALDNIPEAPLPGYPEGSSWMPSSLQKICRLVGKTPTFPQRTCPLFCNWEGGAFPPQSPDSLQELLLFRFPLFLSKLFQHPHFCFTMWL